MSVIGCSTQSIPNRTNSFHTAFSDGSHGTNRVVSAQAPGEISIEQGTFFDDNFHHLRYTLKRLGLRFQVIHLGDRDVVKRVIREQRRRTYYFQVYLAASGY